VLNTKNRGAGKGAVAPRHQDGLFLSMGYLHDLCFGRFFFGDITDDKPTYEDKGSLKIISSDVGATDLDPSHFIKR
jgi:hypothetical protein